MRSLKERSTYSANVKVAMHIVGVASSEEFALKLLEEAGVATVSGENFGCNGF